MTTGTSKAAHIARARAVKDIAGHLADRDAFVAMVDPDHLELLVDRLDLIPDWTAYIDNGTEIVLRTTDAPVLLVIDMLIPIAVILTIPKTVPAATIGGALSQPVPEDGSQDILMIGCNPEGPMVWSRLFLDALERVDPKAATTIRAAMVPNLN